MAEQRKKKIVFVKPNGGVVAIEEVEGAKVVGDYLEVPASVHRKHLAHDAYWRGMHYPTRPKRGEV